MSRSSQDRKNALHGGNELVYIIDSPKNPSPDRLLRRETPQFTPNNTDQFDDEQIRLQREEEESLELARRLMAEEAMASYEQHFQLLRESADQLSQEDYDALQRAIEENERDAEEEVEHEDGDLSYDAMLELGERIGDVKTERWTIISASEVSKLPTFKFVPSHISDNHATHIDDSEHKCLVCQFEYENNEDIRRLPCGHCFHKSCVDVWLQQKDMCPYCRQCIVKR
jgi:Ring finger domain